MLTNVNQKWQKMLTFVNFGGFLLTLLTCHLCGNVTQNVNFWGFLKKKRTGSGYRANDLVVSRYNIQVGYIVI